MTFAAMADTKTDQTSAKRILRENHNFFLFHHVDHSDQISP